MSKVMDSHRKGRFAVLWSAALLTVLLALVGLSACGRAAMSTTTPAPASTPTPVPPTRASTPVSATPTPSLYPVTITDMAGREVTVQTQPQAIVSLAPANTEMLYALGLGDKVVGVTEFCNYPPEAGQKPKVGGFSDISTEKVVELAPDLILADSMHIAEVVPALEDLGLKVVVIDPTNIPAVLEGIELLGTITEREKEAQALTAQMQEAIDAIAQAVDGHEKLRVFWELSSDLWTAGPGSFIDDLIVRSGGGNIAVGADSSWLQLSNEAIIAADPEVILLADHPFGATMETVAARPGWDKISAVVNNRIIEISDTDLVSRPGPRVVEALKFVAKVLHPDAFE